MKKSVGSLLMTGTLLLGTVAPLVVNADTQTGDVAGHSAKTDTNAEFTRGNQITMPYDPDQPEQQTKHEHDAVSPMPTSPLALVSAPQTLDFGTHTVDLVQDQEYQATGKNTSVFGKDVAFEVSDVRSTSAGWHLTAMASPLTNGSNDTNLKGTTLKGATIKFAHGNVITGGIAGSKNINGASATDRDLPTDGSTSQTILSAPAGNGDGVTIDKYATSDIKLEVLADTAKVGTYTGNITWSLADTPS